MASGGRRPGSGRKKEPLKMVSVRIHEDTVKVLNTLSNDLGISKGKVVDHIVRWYVEDSRKEGRL